MALKRLFCLNSIFTFLCSKGQRVWENSYINLKMIELHNLMSVNIINCKFWAKTWFISTNRDPLFERLNLTKSKTRKRRPGAVNLTAESLGNEVGDPQFFSCNNYQLSLVISSVKYRKNLTVQNLYFWHFVYKSSSKDIDLM